MFNVSVSSFALWWRDDDADDVEGVSDVADDEKYMEDLILRAIFRIVFRMSWGAPIPPS